MKYGLPREEKPKKKWKIAIENELRCLKKEVCFLKDQLNDAKNQLAAWTSPNRLAPFSILQGFSRNEHRLPLSSQNDNNNNFSCRNEPEHPFSTAFNINSNERVLTNSLASPQGHPFPSGTMGTDGHRYEPTWGYDSVARKSLRLHSISCMPCYEDKSFEELRLGDYMSKGIGFSNQIQRYKDSIQRSARSSRNDFSFTPSTFESKNSELKIPGSSFIIPWYLTPKPPKPWPFGPSSGNNEKLNSPASDRVAISVPQTSNDLKLQDEQNKSQSFFTFRRNTTQRNTTQNIPDTETEIVSDFRVSKKDENLSSQILIELRKMGEQMSTINDRLSTMDSNLSDMSLQVSVMDSRLTAVDMFVTMQRFDKKWQDLETRLVNIETPSPAKVTALPCNTGSNKETTLSKMLHLSSKDTTLKEKMNISCSFEDKKINITQTSDFGKPNATITTPVKHEAERLSAMDITDTNLSDFVRSVSCTDSTNESSSLLDISTASNSPLKIKPDNAPIEMADLKSCNFPPFETTPALIENLHPRENESLICNSEPVSSVPTNNNEQSNESANKNPNNKQKNGVICHGIKISPEGKKLIDDPELQIVTLDKDSGKILVLNDPLGVTEQKDSSAAVSGDLLMKEVESYAENEFVIVEKSDVEKSVEENSKVKTISSPLNEASSSSEFKMYSDITEYLEINLGKKKNLVYEFGFEAKPSYSPGSKDQEKKLDGNQENSVSTSSADDSFQQFKINFTENESAHEKQSSPFVVVPCFLKPSQKTPDQCRWMSKKFLRARRHRYLKCASN